MFHSSSREISVNATAAPVNLHQLVTKKKSWFQFQIGSRVSADKETAELCTGGSVCVCVWMSAVFVCYLR